MNQSDPVFVIDSTSGFACHAEASAKAGTLDPADLRQDK
jgi:hypothetical protein